MIAFAGSSDSLYLVKQLQKAKGFELTDLSVHLNDIDLLIHKFLETDYEFFIVDLESFIMDTDIIVENFTKLSKVCTGSFIFLAKAYSISSTIIQALRNHGFKKFVFGETLGDIKAQLSSCLDGIDNVSELEKQAIMKFADTSISISQKQKPFYKVSFCGTQERIGTTSQAINFAKYLQFKGFKVCYIEANFKKQIAQIPSLYSVQYEDKTMCKIIFENLDMYYDIYKISKIYDNKYDVYIYDMGVLKENNRFNFLDSDLKIIVAGSKAWEIDYTINALKILNEDDVNYIFNFTDKAIRQSLKEDMQDKKDNIFFCEYSPNMFCLNSQDKSMHEELAKNLAPVKTQKKKSLFNFKKGR